MPDTWSGLTIDTTQADWQNTQLPPLFSKDNINGGIASDGLAIDLNEFAKTATSGYTLKER